LAVACFSTILPYSQFICNNVAVIIWESSLPFKC